MLQRSFLYQKEVNADPKSYEVILIRERGDSFEGLSLEGFSEEDKVEVVKLFQEFEAKIDPYMKKGWRKFLNAKVVHMTEVKK